MEIVNPRPVRGTVYKSENYDIYSSVYDHSKPIFISFMFRNKSPQPFGEVVFAKHFLNAIHVLCRGPHWYQYEDTELASQAIRDFVVRFPRIVTYGTSMGGYAALLFSKAVGADVVISCSPQFSVDPAKVPFETRWLDDVPGILAGGGFVCDDMATSLSGTARIIVAYDSLDDDARHFGLLEKIRPIEGLCIPFSKHRALTVLAEMGLSSALVRRGGLEKLDLGAFRKQIRQQRRVSPTYLRYIGRSLEDRSPHRSRDLLETASLLTKPGDYEGIESNFRILLRVGGEQVAARQLLKLLSSREFIGRTHTNRSLTNFCRLIVETGLVEQARSTLQALVDQDNKSSPGLRGALMIAHLHEAAGQREAAVETAVSLLVRDRLLELSFEVAALLDVLGMTAAAIEIAEAMQQRHTDRSDVAIFLAEKLQALGSIERALDVYQELSVAAEPMDVSFCLKYSRLLQSHERYDEAVVQCERFVEQNPNHAVSSRLRGQLLMSLGQHEKARGAFAHALSCDSPTAAIRHELAIALLALGRKAEALDTARSGLSLEPGRRPLVKFVEELEGVP